MHIGVFAPLSNPFATPEYIAALGPASEERGFHSLWVAEHVVLFDDHVSRYPYGDDGTFPMSGESGLLEPFTAMAFLAASTSRIRLGTGICLVPQRNPVYTAKEVAAVDWLSSGRVDFGIGVGWQAEEFRALNVPFDRRGDRCREYVAVMRALWTDPVSEYHGELYDLPACRQFPKPVQQPHPPIHVGGDSNPALRRVAELGQGWYGFSLAPEDVPERIATLEKLLAERRRTRSDVVVSVCPYTRPVSADDVKRYEDAGVDQLILIGAARDVPSLTNALDALANAYI